MKKDRVFLRDSNRASDFEFNEEVAKVFDDMVVRSIPHYLEQQDIIKEFVRKFYLKGTNIYDLGCSTATTLINLCRVISGSTRFIGYDNSYPMINEAKKKIEKIGLNNRIEIRYGDLNGELSKIELDNAGVVMMLWTLQFIRPFRREALIKWVACNLVKDGFFIMMEKVLTKNKKMNHFFIDFYYDFKRNRGYSDNEILQKREALENVLIPYSIDENIEMLHRNGFDFVETFFQWFNFIGFLCRKKSI